KPATKAGASKTAPDPECHPGLRRWANKPLPRAAPPDPRKSLRGRAGPSRSPPGQACPTPKRGPFWMPIRGPFSMPIDIHRLGEIRDRTYENQQHRASGLNLLVWAITLWNTRYLNRALAALREAEDVSDHLLAHLSPLGWEHINLTGDYV